MILSVIIFLNINLFLSKFNSIIPQINLEEGIEINEENPNKTEENKNTQEENLIQETKEIQETQETSKWSLEIPSIDLNAPIAEGTTKEIMDEFIGHFEETVKINGNVGLIAHNRGYKNNYFANIKTLQKGDIIIYYYNGEKIEYQVETVTIIKDTDWSYLEETQENTITLITCVENQPEYRRCIQGKEMEEKRFE